MNPILQVVVDHWLKGERILRLSPSAHSKGVTVYTDSTKQDGYDYPIKADSRDHFNDLFYEAKRFCELTWEDNPN